VAFEYCELNNLCYKGYGVRGRVKAPAAAVYLQAVNPLLSKIAGIRLYVYSGFMGDEPTKTFAPRFIEFVAVAIFGVGVHRSTYGEYVAGGILIAMGGLLFGCGHFWERLTRHAPKTFKETAANAAQNFYLWVGVVLLVAGYFAVFPLPTQKNEAINSRQTLLALDNPLDGTPLGFDWNSASFLWDMGASLARIIHDGPACAL
jgi:hypothetical protein